MIALVAGRSMIKRDKNGIEFVCVPLVGKTGKRLKTFARHCATSEESLAASLLHDILEEDEARHVSPGDVSPASSTVH